MIRLILKVELWRIWNRGFRRIRGRSSRLLIRFFRLLKMRRRSVIGLLKMLSIILMSCSRRPQALTVVSKIFNREWKIESKLILLFSKTKEFQDLVQQASKQTEAI